MATATKAAPAISPEPKPRAQSITVSSSVFVWPVNGSAPYIQIDSMVSAATGLPGAEIKQQEIAFLQERFWASRAMFPRAG
jgi:hypothetical protein